MRILISNDDGVHALGLRVLYEQLRKFAKVTVVAPLEERSTTGHALTLHKPLRMIRLDTDFYGVSGSPADCVYLGLRKVLKRPPNIVVSGINRGANMGQDVYYSGTVSAAREACILGLPALAVSLDVNYRRAAQEEKLNYLSAAKVAARLIPQLVGKKSPLNPPSHTLWNLNVPDLSFSKMKGIQMTRQGFRFYSGGILQRKDHRGKDYYWVGGSYQGFRRDRGSDCDFVEQGFASLTPLKLDSTDFDFLQSIQKTWELKGLGKKL